MTTLCKCGAEAYIEVPYSGQKVCQECWFQGKFIHPLTAANAYVAHKLLGANWFHTPRGVFLSRHYQDCTLKKDGWEYTPVGDYIPWEELDWNTQNSFWPGKRTLYASTDEIINCLSAIGWTIDIGVAPAPFSMAGESKPRKWSVRLVKGGFLSDFHPSASTRGARGG